ncbi:hypothetical protein MHH70_12385 [Metasolibacillus sp. FSL H7-0170]|uniref:hypothetical protein n=1 Tax=Metasolibacillus sp. FSL H7-0170 TaxID=2921431 RepID=UPI00315939C8
MKNTIEQFLAQEEELLTDFLLDMEESAGNKAYGQAVALWSMQTTRVGAIRDVLALLAIPTEN